MAKAGGIDLSKLSIEELETLAKATEAELTARREAERERVLQQMRELAASIGTTPEELFRMTGKSSEKAVRYRHPEDPTLVWSGRGKRPQWVNDYLATGKTLDDLGTE